MHNSLVYRYKKLVIAVLMMVAGFAPSVNAQDDYQQLPSLRKVSDSVVRGLQRDKDFAYANDPSFWQEEKEEPRRRWSFWNWLADFFSNKGVKTFFYVGLIALFIFIIYRIVVVNRLYLFYSSKKARFDDESDEAVLQDENIDDKIKAAVNARDYRSAVRLYYLKGLRLLNDRGLIRYHAQATNHDYIHQLSQYPVVSDFRFLTRVYDYVWYGEFTVNEEQFATVQNNFQQFYRAIK